MILSRAVLLIHATNFQANTALNSWLKNLALAFEESGLQTDIHYINSYGERTLLGTSTNIHQHGFKCNSILQKIRSHLETLKIIGNYDNSIIVPIYHKHTKLIDSLYTRKAEKSRSVSVRPSLEQPISIQGYHNDRRGHRYMCSVANTYHILLAITHYIEQIYISHGRTRPSFVNPIIVDTDLFTYNKVHKDAFTQLLYCGNLLHQDEMIMLFKSFLKVKQRFKNLKLKIVGGIQSVEDTNRIISSHKNNPMVRMLSDSITFTGTLNHNQLAIAYSEADVLLLPRPFGEYSKAGFPTKIGEYLASGTPVVTTATGDLPLYLSDESAFLVHTDDPDEFARSIELVLSNTVTAMTIAKNGRAIAEKHFSISATAERLRNSFNLIGIKWPSS